MEHGYFILIRHPIGKAPEIRHCIFQCLPVLIPRNAKLCPAIGAGMQRKAKPMVH